MKPIERLFACWAIGSGGDPSRRMLQWIKPENGWRGFIDTYVKPVLAQGVTKVWLHSPFGREGTRTLKFSDGQTGPSNYRFDEFLCSKLAGLEWNTDGFVEAIKPWTKTGIEVCCYLGTLDGTFEFEDRGKYSQRKFFQRVTDSLAPVLDSGCSVAIDSSCRASADSYVYAVLSLLKARGVRVYIEAVPLLTHPHLFGMDLVCGNTHWTNVVNNPQLYPKVSQLTGKIVRGFWEKPAQYTDVKSWYMDEMPKVLNENKQFMATANFTHFINQNGKISELISKIGE